MTVAHTPAFSAEVFQNQYLPAGGTAFDAVVTVTVTAADPAAPAGPDRAPCPDCGTARAGRPHPVGDGDRIHLGAWTTLSLRRAEPLAAATAGR
ncbi:MAG TPA: hypothetical protein VL738_45090 [Dactylosporangium sp.]|jgi:hypothetical protein|nr:hypothetical protein [Dactylosporangium sp.]